MSALDGRVAVVTGVSRQAGIGFAVARRLLADGASVLCHSWSRHDAEQPWGADPLAAVVAWLVSDDAVLVTGDVIDAEAGFRRWVM